MTHVVLPNMVGRNSGHGTYPGGGVYCSTKYALRALIDTLRMELIGTNVQASLISPGMAKTEFSSVRFYGDQEKADAVYQNFKALEAKDIAEAIIFIASRPSHVKMADLIIYPQKQASPFMTPRKP